LGTGRTGKDTQACFRFCFIQQFIALCQFVNWSGPPLFPGPQNLYKGRLVGNTQKAAEQQHTDCHKTGSQARLRRSCERDLESWPRKKWQISWLKAESLCSIFKFRLESVACESVQIIQLAKREIKLKKKTCSKPSADCTRECVCGCLCGAEKKKGERKGRMQLTTTSSMSII